MAQIEQWGCLSLRRDTVLVPLEAESQQGGKLQE